MARELLDDSSSDSSDSETGGAQLLDLKVNEDFAKRFEHNKKREELQRLEEKLGKFSNKRKRTDEDASESDSSSSEDEDDEGELATAALDTEIFATLNAIKSKDPRVYDDSATFYTELDDSNSAHTKEQKEKPLYLRDYHRENLLNGIESDNAGNVVAEPLSYNQEQEQLKRSIVSEMHAAANASASDDEDSDSEGGLLIRKSKPDTSSTRKSTAMLDVGNADRDPETFLSNFMASRAWVPTDRAELHPFESDDSEEENRAEEFEEAYNLRFEDPQKSNETLRSHARDIAAKYSVRRDEKNSRKKKRDAEKALKEAAKQELREDKARLKKLKMEEVEEKIKRVKRAAGLKSTDIQPEDWSRFIDDEWDDSKWEEEMQRRFGDQYYAENEDLGSADDEVENGKHEGSKKKRRNPKKPKFDDDIDIKDIVPDFKDDEEDVADLSLSEDEQADADSNTTLKKKSKKQERIERQKESKRERRIIEQLVDDQMQLELDHALPASSRNKSAGFRYRATSPQSFGLSSRDILLADDTALNEFAGLKKLASWRDEEKKRKDKKHLGKKARLRKWRAETFGNENGVEDLQLVPQAATTRIAPDGSDNEAGGVDIREGGKKKKGRRRKKAKTDGEGGVAIEA